MRHIAILSGVLLLFGAPALAQNRPAAWYAGAGVGWLHDRFQPDYTTLAGGDDQQFLNEADGLQVDLIAGRRTRLGPRMSLGVQGTFSVNRFAWTLSLPSEPAMFRYSLPDAATATLVPEVHVGAGVSIFGEVGGGAGRVHQIKNASPYSTYDYHQWRGTLTAGGGVRIGLGPRLDLVAAFHCVRYARYEFDTFNAQGVHVEHVRESPRARGVSVALTTSF